MGNCAVVNCIQSYTIAFPLQTIVYNRHNRIRGLLAPFLTEVCPNVSIEPAFQPLSGETLSHRSANVEDRTRLDVKAQNFWAVTGGMHSLT